jgi:putative glutathione S-transferase
MSQSTFAQTESVKPKPKGKSLPPKLAIKLVKWGWTSLWQVMMSQLAPGNKSGEYTRPSSQFRNFIGKEPENPYQPAADRYQLYVGMGCPWAHRTLVVRTLKGIENAISVATVSPSPEDGGWVLDRSEEGCQSLRQLYELAQPGYEGRATVPVLWDKQTKAIVNNESSEIIVMLNSEFDEFAQHPELNLYPEELKAKIDWWNEKIYPAVNNGVYRCGFARTQAAYEEACNQLFATLDEIEATLETNRYLCGVGEASPKETRPTLADVRLFTTLFRFDIVYYGLFKCNRRRIQDYQNLGAYLRDLYQLPGVADTCDLESVKRDYYGNLFPLNPGGIIPLGPDLTKLWEPHDRDRLGKETVLKEL